MAFQAPSIRQELANRKILEELQLKKQMLKQGVAQASLNSSLPASLPVGLPAAGLGPVPAELHLVSPAQRQALQNANSQSFGCFVCQDSSFGNLILPVLPRFENKPAL